ncbi:hypothetical protein B0H13DRAFT_2429646 [Mycena leptocephala]|nr:hypothetical protein B0H13DRAFT_2429646 [Mycena leptocephala]
MANQMQSQLLPHSAFTLDNTLGAAVIGFAASCAVFGILLTQVWTYFGRYNSDSAVKLIYGSGRVLEATDQVFIGYFVYFYTVTSAGNPLVIVTGTNTWSIIGKNLVAVAYLVLNYFFLPVAASTKLRRGHHSKMALLALGQLGVAMVFTVQAFQLSSIPAVFNLKTLATISLGLGLSRDMVTAGALCFFFRRMRTTQKNSAANSIINRLVGDAINTSVLTTAVSLSTLLLFDFLEGNLFFGVTYFMLSKLYAVSLLATLNTRRVVRGQGTDRDQATMSRQTARTRGRSVPPEVGTNMFHLGAQMSSMHEVDAAYLDFDTVKHEPGYLPESELMRVHRNYPFAA